MIIMEGLGYFFIRKIVNIESSRVETVVLTITLSVALMAILGGWAVTDSIVGAVQGREARDEMFIDSACTEPCLPSSRCRARRRAHRRLRRAARLASTGSSWRRGAGTRPDPDEVIGGAVLTGLLGVAVGVYFDVLVGMGPCSTPAFAGICMAIPFLYLNDRIRKRQKEDPQGPALYARPAHARGRGGARLHGGALAHRRQARGEPVPGRGQEADGDLAMGKTRGEGLKDMASACSSTTSRAS